MSDILAFVGVSTGSSAVHEVFPGWCRCLGTVDATMEGVDLPLDSPQSAYEAVVQGHREGRFAGCLITSHKAAMFDAVSESLDRVTSEAAALREIGMLYWEGESLVGGANDAVSVTKIFREILDSERWLEGSREVVVFGAGGAGLAIARELAGQSLAAARAVVVCESDPERATRAAEIACTWGTDERVTVRETTSVEESDAIVGHTGQGAIVVNATGLGKDRVGSPVSPSVRFPERAMVFEANYRFVAQPSLYFHEIALSQAPARGLVVDGGWDYFLWGWLVVMRHVYHATPSAQDIDCFRRVAASRWRALETWTHQ